MSPSSRRWGTPEMRKKADYNTFSFQCQNHKVSESEGVRIGEKHLGTQHTQKYFAFNSAVPKWDLVACTTILLYLAINEQTFCFVNSPPTQYTRATGNFLHVLPIHTFSCPHCHSLRSFMHLYPRPIHQYFPGLLYIKMTCLSIKVM